MRKILNGSLKINGKNGLPGEDAVVVTMKIMKF